jgi:chemotaxis protein MotB
VIEMSLRRKQEPAHENHERWLVSYADFITLMFAFFVVMFASSQADKAKTEALADAVERAFSEGAIQAKLKEIMTGQAPPVKPRSKVPDATKYAELTQSLKALTSELDEDIKQGKLQVSMERRGLVISLKEATFFPSGDDTVSPEGFGIIEKVARTIMKTPNPVRLEGHTDSIPIKNGRFRHNWDLSAARSIAMLQLLNSRFGVPARRLAVVGYGDTVAIDTNETAEGRARNRRVDITVLNESAGASEATAKK